MSPTRTSNRRCPLSEYQMSRRAVVGSLRAYSFGLSNDLSLNLSPSSLALQSAFAVIPGTTIGFGHRSRKGNALGRARLVPLVPTAQGQQRQEREKSDFQISRYST